MDAAQAAKANAYAPYPGFAVGAAVRIQNSGSIYVGANFEISAYDLGICAEVVAVTSANSAGDRNIEAIAIVGHKFKETRDASKVARQPFTTAGCLTQAIREADRDASPAFGE